MPTFSARSGWASGIVLLGSAIVLSGCASLPLPAIPIPFVKRAEPVPTSTPAELASDDDDYSDLVTQLRSDLGRYNARETQRKAIVDLTKRPAAVPAAAQRDHAFADRAASLFAPLNHSASLTLAIRMPVVGVGTGSLDDSWHAPRDGGSRKHKGIDIFAPKGTEVVAVADGVISFIGDQRLGGHCIWLTTEEGASFYYAHLDRWAAGLYEGMSVQSGDLLGYVGNTGNAANTPSHLHFGINQNDEMVNPYPVLTRAVPTMTAHAHVELGGGFGTH